MFIFKGKLATCLKIFRSFRIVQHIGKKGKQKEVANDSKFKIVKNFVMELKMPIQGL